MNTRNKRKFKIHTGSVFEMPFKIAKTSLKGKKKIFKVCLVSTLNLRLKVPEKMQKTRDECDHFRLRKRPKTAKNRQTFQFVSFFTVVRF